MATSHERASLPWFKEAPARLLADFTYQSLTLEEKGYLHVLRNQYWVNGPLPADNESLDRIMAAPPGFSAKILPKLLGTFLEVDADNKILDPVLDHYRSSQLAGRRRMSAGGKRGAQVALQRRRPSKSDSAGGEETDRGQPDEGYPKGSCSLSSSNSSSTSGLYNEANSLEVDPWVEEYNKEEKASALSRPRC